MNATGRLNGRYGSNEKKMKNENEIQPVKERVKEIKQSFRLLMNGVTAQSMRDKGVDYHINWGASLPHLREMAAEYQPDHTLALELWKENVRECKILATMLMPKEEFTLDLALQWTEQTQTQEVAEIAAMNLYQHLPYAMKLALMLVGKADSMARLHGFTIFARLFAKGQQPEATRHRQEFLKQAIEALQNDNIALRHSAWNAVSHFAEIDNLCYTEAKNALKSIKMEDWL